MEVVNCVIFTRRSLNEQQHEKALYRKLNEDFQVTLMNSRKMGPVEVSDTIRILLIFWNKKQALMIKSLKTIGNIFQPSAYIDAHQFSQMYHTQFYMQTITFMHLYVHKTTVFVTHV